jgi:hypothetical protein
MCKTEWIAYVDSDDMCMPMRFNISDLNGDLFYSDCYVLDKKGTHYYRSGEFDRERLKRENYIPFSSIMVRTDIAKEIPFEAVDEKFEDWIWLNKVANAGYKFCYRPYPTVIYRDFSHPYGRIPVVRKIKRIFWQNTVREIIETLSD